MILYGFPEIPAFPDSAKFRGFLIMWSESVGSIGESGLRGVVFGGVGAVKTMGSGGVRHEAENPQRGNPTEIPEMQTRTSSQKTTKMRPEIL